MSSLSMQRLALGSVFVPCSALQSINLGAAPLGAVSHLPALVRMSLKSCGLPSLPTLAPASAMEWWVVCSWHAWHAHPSHIA